MPTRGPTVTGHSYVLRPRGRRKRWMMLSMLVLVIAGHWWWGNRAEHHFQLAVAALRRSGEPTSPYDYQSPEDRVPDSDNAARVVEAAALQIVGDYSDEVSQLEFQLPLTERESCLIDAHVSANTEPVAFLQRGHERKRAALDVYWQCPAGFIVSPPYGRYDLGTLLKARAILAHHNGNDRDALERVWDLLFLARVDSQLPLHCAPSGSSGAWTTIAIAPELRILAHDTFDGPASHASADLVRKIIHELLDKSQLKDGIRAYLRARRVELIRVFERLALGKLGMDDVVFGCGCRPPASGYLFKPLILRDAAVVVNEFAAAIDAMEQPSLPAFRSAAPQLVRNGSVLRFYATMLAPRYDDLAKRHYQSLAARRLAACALAIRWYQCEHEGQFPASLDALVPEYLPVVPLDPLAANDRPLTYVPDEPRPRVYSVGTDGQDDGGEPDSLDPSRVFGPYETDLLANLRRLPRYDKSRDYELFVQELYGDAWELK